MLSGVQGGMSLSSLTGAKSMDEAVGMAKLDGNNSQYTDEVRFETTPEMDRKIFNEVSEMQEDVHSGKVEYNVVSMNCTDAVEKPIERATGADFPNDIVPNKNFENVKSSRSRIQAQINLEQGTHEVKFVPSGLDNYPSSTRPVIILKEKPRDNN